jgi:hypothetical protein
MKELIKRLLLNISIYDSVLNSTGQNKTFPAATGELALNEIARRLTKGSTQISDMVKRKT